MEGYLITGVQLGCLIGLAKIKDRKKFAEKIIDQQQIIRKCDDILDECKRLNKNN